MPLLSIQDSNRPHFTSLLLGTHQKHNALKQISKNSWIFSFYPIEIAKHHQDLIKRIQFYIPNNCLNVDEGLWGFRGYCALVQYIKNKPDKIGLKYKEMEKKKVDYLMEFIKRNEYEHRQWSIILAFHSSILHNF